MRTTELLLSSLNITEDEYNYEGLFFLSVGNISMKVDMTDFQNHSKIEEIKDYFNLDDTNEEVRKILMDKIMEKVIISSRNNEGENYNETVKRNSNVKSIDSLTTHHL